MAVDIVVARDPADLSGPDIKDIILSTTIVAIHRGTTEINDSEPTNIVRLSTNYRANVLKGQIVEVLDELQGSVWRGRIVGISHSARMADIFTNLDIEKPTRLYT